MPGHGLKHSLVHSLVHGAKHNVLPFGGLTQNGVVVLLGDSNTVGLADVTHMDNGLGWQNAYSSVQMTWHYATSTTDPMTWIDVARQDLQPYDPTPGNPAIGPEQALGRYLVQYHGFDAPVEMYKFAASGLKATNVTTTAASPLTPKRLILQLQDGIDTILANSGKQLGVVVYALGTNDAGTDANSDAFAANLADTEAFLRLHYGPNFLFCILLVNSNMTAAGTLANRNKIRAAALAFAAAHPVNCIAVTPDRIPVSNSNLHYVADEEGSVGNMLGEAISEALRPRRAWDFGSSTGPAAWLQSNNEPTVRSQIAASGNLTPRGPARDKAGDWHYLLVGQGTEAVAPALTTANGFTLVASGFSTTAGLNQYLALYERICDQATLDANGGRMPDPVVTDGTTSKQAVIFSVRNAYKPGVLSSAIEATQLTANNASNTPVSAAGVTTLGTNRLIAAFQTGFASVANGGSGWTDATLSGFALVRDSFDDINETSALATGTLAAAGASGTVTGTRAGNTIMENLIVAIRPLMPATDTELTATFTDATDPITGGQNEVYTFSLTNAGNSAASSITATITLDSNLTYVSATGTGWTIGRSGQVITATLASLAAGTPASDVTITATTPLSSLTVTTTVAVTCSNAASLNLSQASVVQVTASKDATSNIFVPASATEWTNLGLTAPDFQWECQDAASPLAAAIGGITLASAGTGHTYQDTVSGWSRKGIGTQDNLTQDWASTNAGLPDVASNSVMYLILHRPPASNPAAARKVATVGTSPATSIQVTATGKYTFIGGANTANSTTTVTGGGVVPLVLKYNRTGSETKGYTNADKVTVTFSGTGTGKQVLLGGSTASASQEFLAVYLWKGANAEMTDAQVKSMLQTLGWTIGWT